MLKLHVWIRGAYILPALVRDYFIGSLGYMDTSEPFSLIPSFKNNSLNYFTILTSLQLYKHHRDLTTTFVMSHSYRPNLSRKDTC